ncbi:hypothetical protein RvY_09984-3 [Ramazzottius varieornatus]|uniref:Secreted protein n=1 Tax=Ramazzottius varieornatus TaxID=947166 RepID=A0A1D1VGL2_RAMVA|nr:hypothetical protein RvY_09984-3 [Ramazzottius varieornatus]
MEAWKCCVSYLAITLLSVTGSHSCRVETITSWDVFGITVTKYPYLYLKRYWSAVRAFQARTLRHTVGSSKLKEWMQHPRKEFEITASVSRTWHRRAWLSG